MYNNSTYLDISLRHESKPMITSCRGRRAPVQVFTQVNWLFRHGDLSRQLKLSKLGTTCARDRQAMGTPALC